MQATTPTTTAIAALRSATHDLHVALEKTALARDLLSPALRLDRYVQILRQWAMGWSALETSVHQSACMHDLLPMVSAPRAALAVRDLQFLDGTGSGAYGSVPHPAPAGGVAVLQSASALLGRCYVMRGSALGGRVIARHVRVSLGLQSHRGASFFAEAENEPLSWPQWCKQIELQLVGPQERFEAVEEARNTFQFLLQVFTAAPAQHAPLEAFA